MKDSRYVAKSSLSVNLNRQQYGPLDVSQVFYSEADLDYYQHVIESGDTVDEYWQSVTPYPYPGQIVSLVDGTTVKVYMLVPNSTTIDATTVYSRVEITNQRATANITGTPPIIVTNNEITHAEGTACASTPNISTTSGTKITIPYVTSNTYGHVNGGGSTTVTITLDDGELT